MSDPSSSAAPGGGRNRARKRKGGKGHGAAAAAAGGSPHSPASSASSVSSARSSPPPRSHGHSHGHSHDGVPCGGHGPGAQQGGGGAHGGASSDEIVEAQHYCDVLWHYQSYARHSLAKLARLQSDFEVQPTVLQRLVPTFPSRMQSLRAAVLQNAAFINEIVTHRYVFHNSPDVDYEAMEAQVARTHPIDEERMSRVRSTLRQCVRDWSAEGAAERDACYGPILRELERLYPSPADREGRRVLVPGSGLGRLVWEVASRGFFAQGNEFSYFMLLCSFLILNCCKEKEIFTLFPYVHESKNLVSVADALRPVKIPDVNPASLSNNNLLSMVAGDWMDIYSDLPGEYVHGAFRRKQEKEARRRARMQQKQRQWDAARRARDEALKAAAAATAAGLPAPPVPDLAPLQHDESDDETVPDPPRGPQPSVVGPEHVSGASSNASTWDVVATCYFIDCATQVLEFVRTIAYVLKPGGHWINFGPLLYHYADMPGEVSVELSWEEIRRAAPYFGLELLREELMQPSVYTSDDRSMLQQQYRCVSCTWRKTGEDLTTKPATDVRLNEPKSVAWQSRVERVGESSTVCIVRDSPLRSLLNALPARLVREEASTPSGVAVSVWSVPSQKLGEFLLEAMNDASLSVGKIVLEEHEMLAVLPKP